jgi:hypothetical protein
MQSRVFIKTCNTNATQRWTMRINSTITNDGIGGCLDLYSNNVTNGGEIKVWECNNSVAQKWNRYGINTTQKHALYRNNNVGPYCMDDYAPTNGKQAYMWWCDTNADNHVWETWRDDAGGGYVWRQLGSNYCLNAYNPSNITKAVAWTCDNSDEQVWDWNGSQLIRKGYLSNNQCLNHYALGQGSQLTTWGCNGSDNDQKFSLYYMGE